MTAPQEICRTCRWWQPMWESAGQCIRFPPTIQHPEPEGVFPATQAGWCCGEWLGHRRGAEQ